MSQMWIKKIVDIIKDRGTANIIQLAILIVMIVGLALGLNQIEKISINLKEITAETIMAEKTVQLVCLEGQRAHLQIVDLFDGRQSFELVCKIPT